MYPNMGTNSKWSAASELTDLRDALAELQGSLSLAQLIALMTVAIEPGISVNELGDRLRVPQQSASRHVAVLTGRYQSELSDAPLDALIVQQINETDPRKRALYLTPAGDKLIANMLRLSA